MDLAGSERIAKSGAEGSRLREAQCINKSLSALGDVINALRSKHSHVPFRNSRLTYLLQDSLSGDSKTLMMVQVRRRTAASGQLMAEACNFFPLPRLQVSPLAANMSESACSLKFAQRVRAVELTSSRRHENSSTSSSPTHDSVEVARTHAHECFISHRCLTHFIWTCPQLDSPPVTPVPLPISRASSAGSTLSSASRNPSSSRRRSQSQLSTGRHPANNCLKQLITVTEQADSGTLGNVGHQNKLEDDGPHCVSFCGLIGWFTDRQVDRGSPLVGDGGQVGGGEC